jgi:Mg-chelatase subunit ChlD
MQRADPGGMLKLIRHFLGGGTAIGLALAAAVDEVKELARRGGRGADVILITDGVDGDIDAQRAALDAARALDIRLWTIAIECEVTAESPLRADAAGYAHLDGQDLTDERSARVLDLTKGVCR